MYSLPFLSAFSLVRLQFTFFNNEWWDLVLDFLTLLLYTLAGLEWWCFLWEWIMITGSIRLHSGHLKSVKKLEILSKANKLLFASVSVFKSECKLGFYMKHLMKVQPLYLICILLGNKSQSAELGYSVSCGWYLIPYNDWTWFFFFFWV